MAKFDKSNDVTGVGRSTVSPRGERQATSIAKETIDGAVNGVLGKASQLTSANDLGTASVGGVATAITVTKTTYESAKSVVVAAEKLVHNAGGIKTISNNVIKTVVKTKDGIIKAARITRNVMIGSYSARQLANGIGKGVATATSIGMNVAGKAMKWTVVKGAPKMGSFLGRAAFNRLVQTAKNSSDLGVASIGHTIDAARKAALVAKVSSKVGKKAVKVAAKTTVKTTRTVFTGVKTGIKTVKYIKNHGGKAAIKKAKKTAVKAAKGAAKSVGNLLIKLLQSFGKQLIVPLIAVAGILVVANVLMAPVMGVASAFGGVFNNSETGKEFNLDEFLLDTKKGVASYTKQMKKDLFDGLTEATASYDIVRFYVPSAEGLVEVSDFSTYKKVAAAFPSNEELIEGISPLMKAAIMYEYDNDPSEGQVKDLLKHIMETMLSISEEDTIETDENGVSSTVKTFTLNSTGIYALVDEYFSTPIFDLESKESRTDEEEQQLVMLKDYLEIFEEAFSQTSFSDYSGSISYEELQTVDWEYDFEDRVPCDAICQFAQRYVGNCAGGYINGTSESFWGYLGFGGRQPWCACFVYYVMQESGYGGSYPSSSNYAYCQTMAEAFESEGRFVSGDFTNVVPGDVIYFDWQQDGHTDHTGIVIGRDETKVYTIEGNSSDQCNIRSYNLGSNVIYGYGLMNY